VWCAFPQHTPQTAFFLGLYFAFFLNSKRAVRRGNAESLGYAKGYARESAAPTRSRLSRGKVNRLGGIDDGQ